MEPIKRGSGIVSITGKENALSLSSSPQSSGSNPVDSKTFEHPLLNSLVVDLVVKHLDPNFEQLKTLRLVSKVWTQATLNQWRKSSAVLTLIPDTFIFDRTKYKTGLPISQFIREFQDPESPFQLSEKPFSKYKLRDMNLDFGVCNEAGGEANKIWSAIGPLMESVHFYKCKFNQFSPQSSLPLVKFLVVLIPNLEELVLTDIRTTAVEKASENGEDADELVENKPHFNLQTLTVYGNVEYRLKLQDLLKLAPNLEVIKEVNFPSQYPLRTLLELIYEVRYKASTNPRPLSNLKHVDLINSAGLGPKNLMASLKIPPEGSPNGTQLQLETLSLHLPPHPQVISRNLETFRKYPNSFSVTLKSFEAFRAPMRQGSPYSDFLLNASMTALTELCLWGTIAPDFGFLRSTPNLKKLRIDLGCFEKRDMLRVIMKKCTFEYEKYQHDMVSRLPTDLHGVILCTELDCLEIDYEFPAESLNLLGKWMPNLKTLKTILNGETIPVVCRLWRDLTQLVCLHGSQIENSCFIRDEKKAGFSAGPEPKSKISDLKDLERFQLDVYCNDGKLTDDSVFKGFLKMPALKCVEIGVNSQMSREAEEILKNSVQFCKVLRDNRAGCYGPLGKQVRDYRCDRCSFQHNAEYFGLRRYDDGGSSEDSSGDFSD